ncbi:transcriptional repressor LexA [Gammaproteobacteria bacterium]|nr:transcriptional repressor LexA [Gammaproteobacteria bacterium]MDA7802381.1 transcriptional repressor LexA [Gammaproteobacteria bacterium]MDA9118226.1 transcriptional repressor LexA [Gammaproteobacteria bacterium]
MKDITPQQNKVLNCIKVYIKGTGFPPTRSDICKEMGFKSPNSAETHLRALEKKGFISIASGASRGITIIGEESELESRGIETDNYPIIGLVAAGSPTLASENIEKQVPCPSNFFGSSFDYFLRVKGLSMKDAGIMEDDLIAVQKTHDVKNGDIVVARIDDEVTVKYFTKPSNDKIVLEPANDDFSDIEVDLRSEEFFLEGKYIGLIREN